MSKMRQWTIMTVVAVLVVFAAGWFLLVKPQKSKVSSLKSQSATAEQANQLLLTQIASLQAEQKNLPKQELELQKFSTEVPDNAAEPTLIRQLSAAATGSGVDLITITPGAATAMVSTTPTTGTTSTASTTSTPVPGAQSLTGTPTTGSLLELPVSLDITGTYPNIESFFQSLEGFPRAILVSSWSECPEAPSSGSSGGCAGPTEPSNKTASSSTLGATISADVFFAPAAGSTAAPAVGTTTTTSGTTTGTTTTPSTAATPAATSTPAAS